MKLKKILVHPFFWMFIIGIASIHLVKEMMLARRHAPEPMVVVEDWMLVDQNGDRLSKKDLSGKIVIADFFFTSCPTICPKLTQAMKEIYKRFEDKTDKVHFVSITVDPKTDTPSLLKNFMLENNIDVPNWHCLTGSPEELHDVVVNKMRVHLGEKNHDETGRYDIPHLAHLALFDQNGDLRGLFKTEDREMASLVSAANFLLEKL